jgi:hypothetical protein
VDREGAVMADWNEPDLDTAYATYQSEMKARDVDAAALNDTNLGEATNYPSYGKRWNDTLKKFQSWISSTWTDLVIGIAGGGTGASTALGARTNLGVYSTAQVDSAIDADVATHQGVKNAHGAVSGPIGSRIIVRDSDGRAEVASPTASGEIATKGYVDGKVVDGGYVVFGTSGYVNVTSITYCYAHYLRVGSSVFVSFTCSVKQTANGQSQFEMDLPIATNLGDFSLMGSCVAASNTEIAVCADVTPNPATDKAYVNFETTAAQGVAAVSTTRFYGTYGYRIN